MPLKKLATAFEIVGSDNAREELTPRSARRAHTKSSSNPEGPAQALLRPERRTANSPIHRKASRVIELDCASDVLAALCHAKHAGLVPNRHLTINLGAAGIADPVAAIGRLMKLVRDGCRRHRHSISYIWVREVGSVVGEHVHILIHIPPSLSTWFARRKPGWLKKIGAQRKRGISKTRVIRGAQIAAGTTLASPELLDANLRNVTGYVLKHCSSDVQRHLGIISDGPETIVGKRVSISENLHRTARSRCSMCTC